MTSEVAIEELLEKAKNYKKYARFFNFLADYWIFGFLLAIALVFFVLGPLHVIEYLTLNLYVSIGLVFIPWILIIFFLKKKLQKYMLTDSEWAKYYSYSIMNNLEKYSKSKSQGMKDDYKKDALKKAKEFVSRIKEGWTVGKFDLAKKHCEKPVYNLIKNLKNIVIPKLKKDDDKALSEIEQHMRNFFWEPFSIESINKMNEGLSKLSSTSETITMVIGEQPKFFERYKIVKHGLVVLTLIIGCTIFFNVVVSFSQIQQEYVFGGAIALFIGLLTIYFKQKPAN